VKITPTRFWYAVAVGLILAAGCGYAAMVANSPYTPRTIKQRVDDLEQRVERLERAR